MEEDPFFEKSVAVTGDNELLQAIQTTALQAQAFFKNSPSTMRRLLDTCADSFLACVHLARFSKVRQKEPLVLLRRPGKVRLAQAHELRIATSGSFSINARVALLHVDGGGGDASKPPRVRAAIFAPAEATTIQFTTMKPSSRRPTGTWVGRGDTKSEDCAPTQRHVHALRLLTPKQTAAVLDDVKHIGESIGWSDRGVSLPTQDVLVQNLSKESRDLVHRAIRKKILPFARRHYPHLNDAFDKQPYPCHGNLFIVRYCASSQRPGGRGLELHKDGTALTFNVCLSPEEGFTGGGTYFPANSADVDGLLVKPKPGCCLIHDGNLKHAGNEVVSGQRFILVGFYNADGRDSVGEEQHFSKAALEEQRARNLAPTPQAVQTIYFTTAVVSSARGSLPAAAQGPPPAAASLLLPPLEAPKAEGAMCSADPRPFDRNSSSLASQDPLDPTGAGASSDTFIPIRGKEITAAGGISSASSARGDAAAPERPLQFVGGGCAADADADADADTGTVLYKPLESTSGPQISARGDRPKETPRRHSKQKARVRWGGAAKHAQGA